MGFLNLKSDTADLATDRASSRLAALDPSLPRVTLAQAAMRPTLDFVLPGLTAGSVGLLVGDNGLGKSMLSLDIALGVVSGSPVAGMWTPPATGRCTVIMGEDDEPILQERMHWLRVERDIQPDEVEDLDERMDVRSAVGRDLRVAVADGGHILDGPWYTRLREMAQGQRLIILDPLRLLHDASENDNGQMAHVMRLLAAIARETGCTILVLHHSSKSGAGDREMWTSASGAGAITSMARWMMLLRAMREQEAIDEGVDPEQRGEWVQVSVPKINYGAKPDPMWLRRGRGGVLTRQQTPAENGEVQRSAVQYDRASNGGPSYDRPF